MSICSIIEDAILCPVLESIRIRDRMDEKKNNERRGHELSLYSKLKTKRNSIRVKGFICVFQTYDSFLVVSKKLLYYNKLYIQYTKCMYRERESNTCVYCFFSRFFIIIIAASSLWVSAHTKYINVQPFYFFLIYKHEEERKKYNKSIIIY